MNDDQFPHQPRWDGFGLLLVGGLLTLGAGLIFLGWVTTNVWLISFGTVVGVGLLGLGIIGLAVEISDARRRGGRDR